ncbi:uncharacterized protein FOMMEDRAFT_30554 [Fomitiporia mediterranea MF3/22]|uniref:uncharacterized protein n=1 Tax=Fomitiporia mediterranea (strain MF3/22) TaxID=694068 RepID=UPI0004407680|nr:uncharacterized protein FOMMEDRAFT_30554 [Fomitiporia mediterranea MF3/22]EJD00555.1 hypothetical protein FOMMEDRAFT_30554 [Fomitiporia mediterranea MF3/22]
MSVWKHSRRSRNNPKSSDEAERPILSSSSDRRSSGKRSSFLHSHKDKRKSEPPSKTLAEVFDEKYQGVYRPLYSRVFVKLQDLQNIEGNGRVTLNDLEKGCDSLPHEDDIWEYRGYCSELNKVQSKLKQAKDIGSHGVEDLEEEERWAKDDKESHEQCIDYALEQLCQAFNLQSNVAKATNASDQSLSGKSQVIEDYEYLLEFWRRRDLENLAKSIEFLRQARNYQRLILDDYYWRHNYAGLIQELSSEVEKINEKVEKLRWSERSEESVKALLATEQDLQDIKRKINTELAWIAKHFSYRNKNKETALRNVQTLWENERFKEQLENLKVGDKNHTENERERPGHTSRGHKPKK